MHIFNYYLEFNDCNEVAIQSSLTFDAFIPFFNL